MKRALKIVLFAVSAILLFALPPLIYEFSSYYQALENEVVARFSGKRWNIPSRIYSDSCFVYPGQSLDDLGFFQRLARLNYHRVAPGPLTSRGEYSLDEKKHRLTVFLHNFAYPYNDFAGEAVEMSLGPHDSVLAMRDPLGGKALFSVELEPELISGIFQGSWQQRRLVPLTQIPPGLHRRDPRRRGPSLLRASRHRPGPHRQGRLGGLLGAPRAPGRIDADPAVDEKLLFDQQARLAAQGQRRR